MKTHQSPHLPSPKVQVSEKADQDHCNLVSVLALLSLVGTPPLIVSGILFFSPAITGFATVLPRHLPFERMAIWRLLFPRGRPQTRTGRTQIVA